MLNLPTTLPSSLDDEPLARIRRVIRRICLLREQGGAADSLQREESALAAMLVDYHQAHAEDPLPESRVHEMFAREEQRVAEVGIMAELLIPQLLGRLGSNAAAAPLSAVTPPPRRVEEARPAPPASLAIPDLLDAMLAAERSTRRPAASH